MRTIIDESVYKSAGTALRRMGKVGTVAKKLQVVMSAYKHGINKVSEVFGVSKGSIYIWAKEVKEGSFDNLINKSKHQDGIKIKQEHKDTISNWLKSSPNLTIREIKDRLFDEFNLEVSKSSVHRAIQKIGFSYITPRKQHYKQDQKAVELFKKKSKT